VYVFGLEKMEKLQELEMGENKGGLLALSAREEPRYDVILSFIYLFIYLFIIYSFIYLFVLFIY